MAQSAQSRGLLVGVASSTVVRASSRVPSDHEKCRTDWETMHTDLSRLACHDSAIKREMTPNVRRARRC
jgi:hypothetical protein